MTGTELLPLIVQIILSGLSGAVFVVAALWRILGRLFQVLTDVKTEQAMQGVRLSQIENRIDGNGDSIPSRCKGHSQALKDLERRVGVFE